MNQNDSLCRITQENIKEVLQFGLDRKAFECNLATFADTVTFSFDKNDCDIKDGQTFYLRNNKVAIYTLNQPANSSLRLWQPRQSKEKLKINFLRSCGGSKRDGYLIMECVNDILKFEDVWFMTSIE